MLDAVGAAPLTPDVSNSSIGMTLNPLKWLAWLISEYGPASIQRERIALAQDRNAELERKIQELQLKHAEEVSHLKQAHLNEVSRLKQAHSDEMRRLAYQYATGKGIMIPEGMDLKGHQNGKDR